MSDSLDSNPTWPVDNFVKIHDEVYTGEQLVQEVRQRLLARYDSKDEIPLMPFPTFGSAGEVPAPPTDVPYSFSLYHHLRHVNQFYNQVETEPILTSSPATAFPIIGPLWQQIRHHAHGLVLFYVNRFVGHQSDVNSHLIKIVNMLTAENIAQTRQIKALSDSLQQLQHRLDRLETDGERQ